MEIVERKGKGHPDTICDAVLDQVSVALCALYKRRCGSILHHNCDKGLLVAGAAEHRFGGGRILEPMRLVIGDRASLAPGVGRRDIVDAAIEASKRWFQSKLPRVDVERHLEFQVELRPGSEQLAGIFEAGSAAVLGANDTSAAVGYAPLSETERLVLEAERFLNGAEFKREFPQSGEDVKVLAVRRGRGLDLTVAMPIIDRYVSAEADYFAAKDAMVAVLGSHLLGRVEQIQDLAITFNALDRRGGGRDGIYLSVIGTSAEDADSGEVGRGNGVNGVIALCRPGGAEAACGKNPTSHVGKIYSVLSQRLAETIHREVPGVAEATVWLCSRIGRPVNEPALAAAALRPEAGLSIEDLRRPVSSVVERELGRLPDLCEELSEGKYPLC